jgi:hypothetical protein
MVELDLPVGRGDVAEFDGHWIFYVFAITTIMLIGVHLFALMVSTCILPYVDGVADADVSGEDEESLSKIEQCGNREMVEDLGRVSPRPTPREVEEACPSPLPGPLEARVQSLQQHLHFSKVALGSFIGRVTHSGLYYMSHQ